MRNVNIERDQKTLFKRVKGSTEHEEQTLEVDKFAEV